MKIEIKGNIYGFIWGTRCFINAESFLDIKADIIVTNFATDTKIMSVVIYEGLNLWCDDNEIERPFNDYEDFIKNYDTLGDYSIFQFIVSDIFDSMYMGAPILNHLERVFGADAIDKEENKKIATAKKKYLSILEKSSSTSQVGDSEPKKSKPSRSKNTSSTSTEMK